MTKKKINFVESSVLPTEIANFQVHAFTEIDSNKEKFLSGNGCLAMLLKVKSRETMPNRSFSYEIHFLKSYVITPPTEVSVAIFKFQKHGLC